MASQYETNLWSTHVNIVRLAEPIRRCVRWRTQVFKIEGFVCKRFLPSPPPPSSFIFWFSFHFSRDQNQKSPSTVLFCSETKRKRLLRRLGAPRQSWPIGLQENNNITWIIFFYIILHSAVHMYDFHIFITSSSSFHWFITNQFNDLLSVGLSA